MSLELPSLMLSPRSTAEDLMVTAGEKDRGGAHQMAPNERDTLLTPLRPIRTDSTSDK